MPKWLIANAATAHDIAGLLPEEVLKRRMVQTRSLTERVIAAEYTCA